MNELSASGSDRAELARASQVDAAQVAASTPQGSPSHGALHSADVPVGLSGSGQPRGLPFVALPAIGIVAADQLTKELALRHLQPGVPVPIVGDLLALRLVFNPGAAFSFATGTTWIFTIFAALVVCGVLAASWRRMPGHVAAMLGLLVGGAAGNLVDRVTRPPGFAVGHVVDFLQLPYWPIFNVADMAIVTAGTLLVCHSFIPQSASAPAADSAAPQPVSTQGDTHE